MALKRGLLLYILAFFISWHVRHASPVSSAYSEEQNSAEPHSLDLDSILTGDSNEDVSLLPVSGSDGASTRRRYQQQMRNVPATSDSRRFLRSDSLRYSTYPSPESGTEPLFVRSTARTFPHHGGEPSLINPQESDRTADNLLDHPELGDEKDNTNLHATVQAPEQERPDSWTPKDQDTIVSGWMHAIGSLFGLSSHNSSKAVSRSPIPTVSPQPPQASPSSSDSQFESSDTESNHRRHSRNSRPRVHPDKRVEANWNKLNDGYNYPPPKSTMLGYERLPSEQLHPAYLTRHRSETIPGRPQHSRYRAAAPPPAKPYRDYIKSAYSNNLDAEALMREIEKRRRHMAQRHATAPIGPGGNAPYPKSRMDAMSAARAEEVPPAWEARTTRTGSHVTDEDFAGNEDGANERLSRTEALEMVGLFKRLFETLDTTLQDRGNDQGLQKIHGLLPETRVALADGTQHSRMRDSGRFVPLMDSNGYELDAHGDTDEPIGDQDRPDDTAVSRALAAAARANARVAAAIDEANQNNKLQSSSIDKPADADDSLNNLPLSAPAYGARKKLLEAKPKNVLSEVYNTISSGISSIL